MELKITNKWIQICGLKGSGKTELSKHLLRLQPKHLVVDPLEEYNTKLYKVYRPDSVLNQKCPLAPEEEMEILISRVVKPQSKSGKLKLFLVDEANRFFPSPGQLDYFAGEMVDFNRHWHLTVITVCRRPVQVNTTLIELSDYQIVFNLTGKNDLDYLDSLCSGFSDKVIDLPDYHYALRHGKKIHLCSPIKLDKSDNV